MRGTSGAYEIAQGVKFFNDTLQKYGASRFQDISKPDALINERIGFYQDIAKSGKKAGYRNIFVPTDQINKLIGHTDPTEVLQELKRRDILSDTDKGKLTKRKTLPGLGETRCYWFRIDMGQVESIQERVEGSNVIPINA